MVIGYCPQCNTRYTRMRMNTDFVHDCSNSPNEALANEDVLVVQTSYSDFDGSGGKGPTEVMMQGIVNSLWGRIPFIQGEDNETETRRGNPKSRFRTRRKFTYIDASNAHNER